MMAKIFEGIEELVGGTPLVRLSRLAEREGVKAELLAKLERSNPAGSVKDRVARQMLEDAKKDGILKEGAVIIEPTSGNTGVGLAALAAANGYRAVIVIPDSMSVERRLLLKAYGAEVVLTPGAEGMAGAIRRAEEIRKKLSEEGTPAWIAGQFTNPSNPKAHYLTTGPEIWEDTEGRLDLFVATAGTGGTVTGTGRFLKEKNQEIRVIAAEPAASPVLSGGKPGPHKIQGIGAGFVPEVIDETVYDEVVTVADQEAFRLGRLLARTEGFLCGISSGAALAAACEVGKREENRGKRIVVLLPDTGERYLSTELFGESKTPQ